MPTDLRSITDFDELIAYLGDELDWPVEDYGLEDLTFEYDADELGLKDEQAEKLKDGSIRQLRPLPGGQPFGIFFVEFGRARLPVVVLRRILNALVIKKRNSANPADRQRWDAADLLFISAFGESDDREIAFAHFHKDPDTTEIPVLRVLGWDGSDTTLKTRHVAEILKNRLHWPDDVANHDAWRKQWRSAFRHRLGHVIKTASDLADALAGFARKIRDATGTIMTHESETKGQLRKLHRAFQSALISDLSEEDFADTYAQTVTYGLLTAAISRTEMSEGRHGTALTQEDITAMVPVTNPFLKEMLQEFLKVGGRKGGVDFDELGINEVVELLRGDETDLPAILRDFGNRKPGEDPVIHFYEHFLAAYNKKLRIKRGVFYTPQPVVSYIVRSVHELLQSEFGIADGLASTITWGEMLEKHSDLKLPPLTDLDGEKETISAGEPFVQILDPATGTATFLVEVISQIAVTMKSRWGKALGLLVPTNRDDIVAWRNPKILQEWNAYVPEHLLPRLHGYELMMAPYAIAHMKIGLKLHETGYGFATEERVRVYLTNALEPWVKQLPLVGFAALAHEAAAVNEIKRHKRFTVVVGNPPYSKSSGNRSEGAEQLVQRYKDLVCGEKNVQPLSDDYVKFIAYAFKTTANGSSIVGMITNRSFLDGLIHRGMRKELLAASSKISIIDLHGDSNVGENVPDGRSNDNVFDITQGVAVSIFARKGHSIQLETITHSDIWGTQAEKYQALEDGLADFGSDLVTLDPYYFFSPKDLVSKADQIGWISVGELFMISGMGVKTRRDHFLIDQDRERIQQRFQSLCDAQDIEAEREKLNVMDNQQWSLGRMRDLVRRVGVEDGVFPILYRPFDIRFIWYHREAIERGDSRWPVMKNVLPDGLSLLTSRQSINGNFTSVFIARGLSEMKTAESTRGSCAFPVLRGSRNDDLLVQERGKSNMRLERFAADLRKKDLVEILNYVYAVLHSPAYRCRYAGTLRIEFPNVPATCPGVLFDQLSRLGGELIALHLLESPTLDNPITEFIGENRQVSKVGWTPDDGGTVWLDGKGAAKAFKPGSSGFRAMPEEVWRFQIGGYQVCEKWLKDRGPRRGNPGRILRDEDIAHYHKIVIALTETIRLMAEIDEAIDAHGGWPDAFQPAEKK